MVYTKSHFPIIPFFSYSISMNVFSYWLELSASSMIPKKLLKKTISPGFPLYLYLFFVIIFPSFISKLFPQIFNVGNLYFVINSFCLLLTANIFLSYSFTISYSWISVSDINADLLSLNYFSWIFWMGGIF